MGDINQYFEILGLKPGATIEEVKEAYRDLVKVWHPDRFVHDPKLQSKAQEKFKDINEAYQKIQDFLNNFYAYQEATGTNGKRSSKTDESTTYKQQSEESKHDNSSQQPPKPPREEHSPHPKDYQGPRPWVRYWARDLDLLLLGFPTSFILEKIFPDFTQLLATTGGAFAVYLCILPFVVLLEACILAIFGNTPAKAILKTKVINSKGNTLSFSEAIKRGFYIYFAGYAMGILPITFVTYLWQYTRLKREGKTSWDSRFDFAVVHSHIGFVRITVFVVLAGICTSFVRLANTNKIFNNENISASAPASGPAPLSQDSNSSAAMPGSPRPSEMPSSTPDLKAENRRIWDELQNLTHAQKWDEALEFLTKEIERSPNNGFTYYLRFAIYANYSKAGFAQKALNDLDVVMRLDPAFNQGLLQDYQHRALRCKLYCAVERYIEAIGECDKSLELKQNADAFFYRGSAFATLGNEELSIKDMKAAAILGHEKAVIILRAA